MCYHKSLCDLAEFREMWSQIINFKNEAFATAHSFMPAHLIPSTTETFKAPSRGALATEGGQHWVMRNPCHSSLEQWEWIWAADSGELQRTRAGLWSRVTRTGLAQENGQQRGFERAKDSSLFLLQELVTWSRLKQTVPTSSTSHPSSPILAANIKNSNLPKLASSEIQASVTEISLKTQQGSVRVWPCDKERTGYQWPKSQTWQLSRAAEPWPSTYTHTDPNS